MSQKQKEESSSPPPQPHQSLKANRRSFNRYENFLKSMHSCPLCMNPLSLIHEINEEEEIIKEIAHCSHCEMETRRKKHNIQ